MSIYTEADAIAALTDLGPMTVFDDHIAADAVLAALPDAIIKIAENIFEALPVGADLKFLAALPVTVGQDDRDLSRVHWAFLAAELRALPSMSAEVITTIEGMDLLAAGKEWNVRQPAARDSDAIYGATRAAWHASRSSATVGMYATHAAAEVARASADANAARLRQRDTLLALIAAA